MRPIFAFVVSSAMAVGMPPTTFASDRSLSEFRSTELTSNGSLGLGQSLSVGSQDTTLVLTDSASATPKVIRVAGKGDKLTPSGAETVVVEPAAATTKSKKSKKASKADSKARKVVIEPAAARSQDTLLNDDAGSEEAAVEDGGDDAAESAAVDETPIEEAVEAALSETEEADEAEESSDVAAADAGGDDLLLGDSEEEPAESADSDAADTEVTEADDSEADETELTEAEDSEAEETETAAEDSDSEEKQPVITAVATPAPSKAAVTGKKDDAHSSLVNDETMFPTAAQCGECHQQIYDEWSSSNHAYASISPMFHKFEQKFQELTQGTVGTFCVRCHQQAGTQLGEKRESALWARSQISREGVSCITCHRVKEQFGKVNGERRIEPGKIFEPVYGSGKKSVLKDVLDNKETYTVATSKDERGAEIHGGMIANDQITKSEFCVSCHQVAVNLGIKLEVVWDQFRASPARAAGVTCQDCHMGKVPGKPEGYDTAPTAIVGGREINPGRKHANHSFIGPGYSIAHPGIFPHNKKAQQWTIKQMLKFDWRSGWGTPEFEDKVAEGQIKVKFPKDWADSVDREDARLVIEENLEKLDKRYAMRKQVMENGVKVTGPEIDGTPKVGDDLEFEYVIKNLNAGHNMPSGSLGAQPQIWLNVALLDPDGKNIWETGYVDKNGDIADLHSLEVAAGTIKTDQQLVNFQTKFLTTNVKGTEREMYLPVNFDVDPLPHLRPPQVPTTILNHPPLVRMEAHSLPPLGSQTANYEVPGELITKPGKYRLAFRMRSRAEPIYFMRFVESTKSMEQRMNERMMNFHEFVREFEVKS